MCKWWLNGVSALLLGVSVTSRYFLFTLLQMTRTYIFEGRDMIIMIPTFLQNIISIKKVMSIRALTNVEYRCTTFNCVKSWLAKSNQWWCHIYSLKQNVLYIRLHFIICAIKWRDCSTRFISGVCISFTLTKACEDGKTKEH